MNEVLTKSIKKTENLSAPDLYPPLMRELKETLIRNRPTLLGKILFLVYCFKICNDFLDNKYFGITTHENCVFSQNLAKIEKQIIISC